MRWPKHSLVTATRVAITGVVATLVGFGVPAGPVGAQGLLPPNNPALNLRPVPNFLSSGTCGLLNLGYSCANPCVSVVGSAGAQHLVFPAYDDAPRCVAFLLRSVDAARSSEGVVALSLPSNWYSLTVPEQLFVLADVERVDRGLPPYLGLNRTLSAAAQAGARQRRDPLIARRFAVGHTRGAAAYGSTWASGYSALGADYVWMYEDGWGGTSTPNTACTSPTAPGCWGHRDQLLGSDGSYNPGVGLGCRNCEMGAGFAIVAGSGAFTDLVERPAGRAPAMYFTWAKDVLPFLNP
jgi:hypothetical protein